MNNKKQKLSTISRPVKENMKEFDSFFKNSMKSKFKLLDIINNYTIKRKGKEMRPLLVFLSAKLTGDITKSSYIAASLIQLLHTASLVHDDVVDESYERRGFFSINALWKSKISVLVGDYLLSRGLLIALDNNEFQQLKLISEAVRDMSEGELLQLEKSRKLDITEETYLEIIYKKTASLIASCTRIGALSSGANEEVQEKMNLFGNYLGMAFQMKDDLFDYQLKSKIGKPTGNDIKEKKLTLPLIYVLANSSKKDKKWALQIVRRYNKDKEKVRELMEYVIAKGGLKYTEQKMVEYSNKAIAIIEEFPDSEAKDSLIDLVYYTTKRNL